MDNTLVRLLVGEIMLAAGVLLAIAGMEKIKSTFIGVIVALAGFLAIAAVPVILAPLAP